MQKVREKLLQQIETIQTTLDIKKKELADVEQAIKREYDSKPFFPKYGETYYFIQSIGKVRGTWFSEYCETDKDRIKIHNCFKTKEKAEEVSDKIKGILEDAWNNKETRLAVYDKFGCKGILGEKTHIVYEDGTRAYVGDVILVTSKSNPNYKNILYVFKTNDYPDGAIMGYACSTSTSHSLEDFYKEYIVEKVIDWSELVEGYIYVDDKAKVEKFRGEE